MLIYGFYGIGKTSIKDGMEMVDMEDFGQPSLPILLDAVEKYPIVLADPQWENPILQSKIPFTVVIPTPDRKEEFQHNYRERYKRGTGGGDDKFCKIIYDNWDRWLDYCKRLPAETIIELEKGEWLIDAINYMKADNK